MQHQTIQLMRQMKTIAQFDHGFELLSVAARNWDVANP